TSVDLLAVCASLSQLPTKLNGRAVPFVLKLAEHGDRTAVISGHTRLTYRQLWERVSDMRKRLGEDRRLVVVAGSNELEPLIVYLGALAAGHVVLLAPSECGGSLGSLIEAYDPDVVFRRAGGEWVLDERRGSTVHDLHPDLALLLSTSGSTGSPRLVRLSHHNVHSNAQAIAEYLDIRDTDRAATTLPMHYCYGLSVIHSHLLCGAGLILTTDSVVDARFWDRFQVCGGTTFAGAPRPSALLDRAGVDRARLPHLR